MIVISPKVKSHIHYQIRMDKLRRSEEENEENILRQKSEAYKNLKTRLSLQKIEEEIKQLPNHKEIGKNY